MRFERNSTRGAAVLLGIGVVALACAGCLMSRPAVYGELGVLRRQAYERWREGAVDETMPRLTGELSLSDAVRVALHYSTDLRSVVLERRKATGRVYEAAAGALPTLDASADYIRLDEAPSSGGVAFGDVDNWSAKLELTQPIYKGGRVALAVQAAELFVYLNDEVVRQAVEQAVAAAAQAYYDVLLAERLYEVQLDALGFAEANLRDVEARRAAGTAIKFDVLRARVEVSNVKAEVLSRRNELSLARTRLFRAMGVSQKSDVALTDELTYRPAELSYEEAVRRAFAQRPDLLQSELQLRIQDIVVDATFAEYYPTLEAYGWQGWSKPDPHDGSNNSWGDQWQAGLRLRWTIFDGLSREGRLIQERAALRQAEVALTAAEQDVLLDVRDALLVLANSEELVASQELNLERAAEALRLVRVGSREGVNTELEVLDARSALTQARGLYYEAMHANASARLGVQRAIGLLAPPPGTGDVPEEGPDLEAPDLATGGAPEAP